jgi:hypothetical protein
MDIIGRLYSISTTLAAAITVAYVALCAAYFAAGYRPRAL